MTNEQVLNLLFNVLRAGEIEVVCPNLTVVRWLINQIVDAITEEQAQSINLRPRPALGRIDFCFSGRTHAIRLIAYTDQPRLCALRADEDVYVCEMPVGMLLSKRYLRAKPFETLLQPSMPERRVSMTKNDIVSNLRSICDSCSTEEQRNAIEWAIRAINAHVVGATLWADGTATESCVALTHKQQGHKIHTLIGILQSRCEKSNVRGFGYATYEQSIIDEIVYWMKTIEHNQPKQEIEHGKLGGYEVDHLRFIAGMMARQGVTSEVITRAAQNMRTAYELIAKDIDDTMNRRLVTADALHGDDERPEHSQST